MARYAVEADLDAYVASALRLALLDDDGDGTEDPGLAEKILEASCDEVDNYLGAVKELPISGTIPGQIRDITCRTWMYKAHFRKSAVNDKILADYEKAIEQLINIAEGLLLRSTDPELPERADATAYVTSATRIFGRSNLSLL